MKIKSWIASFLLLSFVVLLTPRSLWHDCTHEVEVSNHQKSSGFTFDKKVSTCDFCDYDLSLSEEPYQVLSIKQQISFVEKPSSLSSIYIPYFDNQELRRGPPALYC